MLSSVVLILGPRSGEYQNHQGAFSETVHHNCFFSIHMYYSEGWNDTVLRGHLNLQPVENMGACYCVVVSIVSASLQSCLLFTR